MKTQLVVEQHNSVTAQRPQKQFQTQICEFVACKSSRLSEASVHIARAKAAVKVKLNAIKLEARQEVLCWQNRRQEPCVEEILILLSSRAVV